MNCCKYYPFPGHETQNSLDTRARHTAALSLELRTLVNMSVKFDTAPGEFLTALSALRDVPTPPNLALEEIQAPFSVAPFAASLSGEVLRKNRSQNTDDILAHGNFSIFYSPTVVTEWEAKFRIVSIVRAEIDKEMAVDPMIYEVARAWLHDSLTQSTARFNCLRGTVTQVMSQSLIGSDADEQESQLEIRSSWSPLPQNNDGQVDWELGLHLESWINLLFATSGSPMLFVQ